MEITDKVAAAFTALESSRRNYFAGIAAVQSGELEDTDANKLRDKLITELNNCKAVFDKC